MTIPPRTQSLAYGLGLGLPVLLLALAALAQGKVEPACVELPDVEAQPGLSFIDTAEPTPACIRVQLGEAR